MKKNSLLLLLMCIKLANAQTVFTNGSVYNFNVGDTIQAQCFDPWNGAQVYSYQTQIITNKIFSASNDTIFYTIKNILFTPPSTYSTSVITQTITNLTAT